MTVQDLYRFLRPLLPSPLPQKRKADKIKEKEKKNEKEEKNEIEGDEHEKIK